MLIFLMANMKFNIDEKENNKEKKRVACAKPPREKPHMEEGFVVLQMSR
jgi:hypothetical protein